MAKACIFNHDDGNNVPCESDITGTFQLITSIHSPITVGDPATAEITIQDSDSKLNSVIFDYLQSYIYFFG